MDTLALDVVTDCSTPPAGRSTPSARLDLVGSLPGFAKTRPADGEPGRRPFPTTASTTCGAPQALDAGVSAVTVAERPGHHSPKGDPGLFVQNVLDP